MQAATGQRAWVALPSDDEVRAASAGGVGSAHGPLFRPHVETIGRTVHAPTDLLRSGGKLSATPADMRGVDWQPLRDLGFNDPGAAPRGPHRRCVPHVSRAEPSKDPRP